MVLKLIASHGARRSSPRSCAKCGTWRAALPDYSSDTLPILTKIVQLAAIRPQAIAVLERLADDYLAEELEPHAVERDR